MRTDVLGTSFDSNALIVDSFAGGGGASSGIKQALGRSPDIAINHDATAIRMHELNHPETKHYREDIWKVDPREACGSRPVALAWFSPDCFVAGTLVLTDAGLIPIESVRVGAMVLTHRGRWRRVTDLIAKKAATVSLRGHGHYGLITTPEHSFYSKVVTTRYPGRRNDETGKRVGPVKTMVENPYWPEARSMVGRLWATPIRYPDSRIPTCAGAELSDEFFYFVGRWLGDGSINKGDVEICCGNHEFDEFFAQVSALPLHRANGEVCAPRIVDRGTTKALAWGNAPLARWLVENCGVLCEGKRVPIWCLAMQDSWRRALLRGYVDADGYHGASVQVSSVSKQLAIGARLLAASLGYAAALYRTEGGPGQIDGRQFEGRDLYCVRWREELQHQTVRFDESHMFSPVREVTETGRTEDVFCISVEEDESFVADGIVVHNCRHFSRAKGSAPVKTGIRGLAWVATRWAKAVKPRVICLENVGAFSTWGPLIDGRPCPKRRGKTFRAWLSQLRNCGYELDFRELVAADYGAPTTRKRLYLIARCDGQPIIWPEQTHGVGHAFGWRPAHEIIDWSLPAKSIFERSRPLAEATMKRIANGTQRFVVGAKEPFIVRHGHFSHVTGEGDSFRGQPLTRPLATVCSTNDKHLVLPFVAKHFGGPNGHQTPGSDVRAPLSTVTAQDHHALVAAFVTKFYGTSTGSDLRLPMPTVTGQGGHLAEVRALLRKYGAPANRTGQQSLWSVPEPDFGAVMVNGERYHVSDLLMRMLSPRELFRAQGFDDSYRIDGFTQEAQIRLAGNSVCPPVARAIVAANLLGERAVAA